MDILQLFALTIAAIAISFACAFLCDRRGQARLRRERMQRRLDEAASDLDAPSKTATADGDGDGD